MKTHILLSAAVVLSVPSSRATVVLTQINLAGAVASQSSDPFGFPASGVINGNVSGHNPDFNHTNNAPVEWVKVEVPANVNVDVIRIFNRTDCCADRLNGAVVKAFSDVAMATNVYTSSAISGSLRRMDFDFGGTQSLRVVEVSHQNQYLHIGEVQLFTKSNVILPLGTNLSTAGIAAATPNMSSQWGGGSFTSAGIYPSEDAVDGLFTNFNHTADFGAGQAPSDQWWNMDFGEAMQIQEVNMSNRGDGCCPERLRDITVQVLDGSGTPVWTSVLLNPGNSMGSPGTIPLDIASLNGGVPVTGNQVRITRLRDAASSGGDSYTLSLGEVAIIGGSIPEPAGLLCLALGLISLRRRR